MESTTKLVKLPPDPTRPENLVTVMQMKRALDYYEMTEDIEDDYLREELRDAALDRFAVLLFECKFTGKKSDFYTEPDRRPNKANQPSELRLGNELLLYGAEVVEMENCETLGYLKDEDVAKFTKFGKTFCENVYAILRDYYERDGEYVYHVAICWRRLY